MLEAAKTALAVLTLLALLAAAVVGLVYVASGDSMCATGKVISRCEDLPAKDNPLSTPISGERH